MQSLKKRGRVTPIEKIPAIAVTAASGRLGHALAQAFSTHGLVENVRLTGRNPAKLHRFHAEGFDTMAADYESGRSMAAAFAGMDTALIISSMGSNTSRIRHHRIAIDAAIAAGVRHIIYTSSVIAPRASEFEWATPHENTEDYLKKTGVPYTILRVGPYFSNFDYLFLSAVQCGRLFFPSIHAHVAYVTQQDVANAAVAVLTGKNHHKKTYHILGEKAVTAIEMAQMLTRITGHHIEAMEMPVELFVEQFRKRAMSDYLLSAMSGFYTALTNNEYAQTSRDMESLAGRSATTASAYLNALIQSV